MTGLRRLPAALPWLLLALASAAGFHYAWRTFPQAFPIISLDLTMDRGAALARADSLARERGFAPADSARTAAAFQSDDDAQTFVELEGGGPAAFQQLIRDGCYAPYTWRVRRFAPGQLGETEIRFTPSGQPYGFRERVPEAEPGPALTRDSALAVAVHEASRWTVPLDAFSLVESGQERRPSGRVDHTFTWERQGAGLKEGRLRLRVVIAGDRPVELQHFLQVPEAFTRRYASIRSANEAISTAALVAVLLLYGVVGVGGGLFLMMRRKQVLWRPAIIAGVVVALLQAAALANSLPLAWMGYDTAVPVQAWLTSQGFVVVLGTVLTVLQIALTAAAAEALTRSAFPDHPQFWRLWSRQATSSAVAGRTLFAYLLIGLDLAWIVWFSRTTHDWQGWWNPSDLLAQPNLLATPLPWVGPVALALQAGFWEECLFRAVPLAGAALLGSRYGRRGLWLAGAMVVQILIFASGHANYPAQPAWARVVELIIPSLVFGLVYLRLGLLPAIIMHFGYDLALMAIPVFVSEAPGILASRVMVLVAGFAPLGVVAVRAVQRRGLPPLPAALRNGGWTPADTPEPEPAPEPESTATPPELPAGRLVRWLYPAGAAGLVAWLALGGWSAPAPKLEIGRAEAIRVARQELDARSVRLGPEWRTLASVHEGRDLGHTLVWRTAGDSSYRGLLGGYLTAPHWDVRFARFEGDVAERAEEWTVAVQGTGTVAWVTHDLPEARPGASLADSAARHLADSALMALGTDPGHLALVSLEPDRRAARTDWTVTYRDPSVRLPEGEARLSVTIAGDEVTGVDRTVHVPEAWEREWSRQTAVRGLVPLASGLLYVLLLIGVLVISVVRWTRQQLDVRIVAVLSAVMLPMALLELANSWPSLQAGFRTTEPWTLQAVLSLGGGAILAGLGVAVAGLLVGLGLPPGGLSRRAAAGGVALGLALSGLLAVLRALGDPPPAATPGHLDAAAPVLSALLAVPFGWLGLAAFVGLVVHVGTWVRRDAWRPAWFLLAGSLASALVTQAGAPAMAAAWLAGTAALLVLDRVGRALGGGAVLAAALTWAVLLGARDLWRTGPPVGWIGLAAGTVLVMVLIRAVRPAPAAAS